jgi:hypothetical protein
MAGRRADRLMHDPLVHSCVKHSSCNATIPSSAEKDQVIRVITVAAKSPGKTLLRATIDGSDWIAPLTAVVRGRTRAGAGLVSAQARCGEQ